MLNVGDAVFYPNPSVHQGIKLTILDRQVVLRPGNKSYIRYLYDNLLDALVSTMKTNIAKHYDNLIVITGKEGSGKSNLAYEVCKRYDPDFSIEEGYIYEFDAFMRKLADLIDSGADRGKVFWMDEATNVASNRDWMHKENKKFIQLLEMMRSRGWTLVMCIPSMERLDLYIREHRVRFNLVALEMGWDNDQTVRRGYFEMRRPVQGYNGIIKFKGIGYGKFPEMDAATKKEYERVKLGNQNDLLKEAMGIKPKPKPPTKNEAKAMERMRRTVVNLRDRGMSYDDICAITGIEMTSAKDMVCRQRKADRKAAEFRAMEESQ